MSMKGLLIAVAILLLAQTINAESNTSEIGKTDRVIVEIEISEKKVFYVDSSEIGFTRSEAKSLCNSLNMTMVRFETEAKWLAVSNWIAESPYSTKWFWTGGKREAGNSTWYWEETGAEIDYFFWAPNQPSLDISTLACISMNVYGDGWFDDACDDAWLFNALCEL